MKESINGTEVEFGPQNIYFEKEGAFTGEISPMVAQKLGSRYALIGHSERRSLFGESDDLIAKKVRAAVDCRLTAMLCVGETLAERQAGRTNEVVSRQLKSGLSLISEEKDSYVIAYEPVWAIGTGQVATPEQAEETHAFIRSQLKSKEASVLYGGSVKPDNAAGLAAKPSIDGFLVGGASLKPKDFLAIAAALK
jgi:triosephosphate isomerase (TIM)